MNRLNKDKSLKNKIYIKIYHTIIDNIVNNIKISNINMCRLHNIIILIVNNLTLV